jgi:hypothetical protein
VLQRAPRMDFINLDDDFFQFLEENWYL